MSVVFLAVVLLVLIYLSVRERVNRHSDKMMRSADGDKKTPPLAATLTTLVGTAGAIYLAVVMLVEFLKIDVPAKIELLGINLEPLATVSILLAIIQPFVLRVFKK